MGRMGRKLSRAAERKAEADQPKEAASFIAVVRKSRTGYIAVMEVVGTDEVIGTCSGTAMAEVIAKAVDAMSAEVDTVTTAKVLIEGRR